MVPGSHYKSAGSLVDVKVEEVLEEVRVAYYGARGVESVIAAVRETVLGLPDEEVSSGLARPTVDDLGVPDGKAAFRFRGAESAVVVGSYAARSLTKPVEIVDLAVRIPKSCFHEKDYLNHRYYAKRILYLSVLERELRRCPAVSSIQWSFFNHDARKPVLLLHPPAEEGGSAAGYAIRLIPVVSTDTFDVSKLKLARSNVRDANDKRTGGLAQPTPMYNSGIVEDMLLEDLSSWLENRLSTSSQLRDAVSLAKVWARQRIVLDGHRDGLSGFLVAVVMAHLSTPAGKSSITEHMSPLQAFRVTMEAVGNGDVLGKGIFLQQGSGSARVSDAKQLMKTTFDVVICDPSGRLNLAHRMTRSALNDLREDARCTLEGLRRAEDGGFESIFLTRWEFGSKFDYHIRLDVSQSAPKSPLCLDEERWLTFDKRVEAVLIQALSERARHVRVIPRCLPSAWNPSQGFTCLGAAPLYAGIILSSIDVALRMADIGPNADNEAEVKKFRAFWGERSALRRFKDGKISETAVWEIEPSKRHLIIERIVRHVLHRHLKLPSSAVNVTAGQLDFALLVMEKDHIAVFPELLNAFETLSKRLRSIENVPLKVVSVQPLSSVFRHTAVHYPLSHPLALENVPEKSTHVLGACVDQLDIVFQLEGSGRWPDDRSAVQKTKVAFCLRIAESMQQKWGISFVASEDAVVLLMQGFAFRLNVLYEKDPTLLNKEKMASSLITGKNVPLNVRSGSLAEPQVSAPKRDLLLRSLHASVLYGLHGVYPAFGPTVRLAKRWLAAHLFSGVVADEAVELLVAFIFVRPEPYTAPSSRITGFLRFLQLLFKHDWSSAPLIVDINGDLNQRDREHIQAEFDRLQRSSSSLGPSQNAGAAMFLATAYDMGSETWTRSSPTANALKRLQAYAKSSASLLSSLIEGDGVLATGWQSLFRTSFGNYDMVILLQHESLPHPSRVLFPSTINAQPVLTLDSTNLVLSLLPQKITQRGRQDARNRLLIGFDPVTLFVDELKSQLGEMCNIWYNSTSSDVIGITFCEALARKAQASRTKKRKFQNGLLSDVESMAREIATTGEGLVKSIHVTDRSMFIPKHH